MTLCCIFCLFPLSCQLHSNSVFKQSFLSSWVLNSFTFFFWIVTHALLTANLSSPHVGITTLTFPYPKLIKGSCPSNSSLPCFHTSKTHLYPPVTQNQKLRITFKCNLSCCLVLASQNIFYRHFNHHNLFHLFCQSYYYMLKKAFIFCMFSWLQYIELGYSRAGISIRSQVYLLHFTERAMRSRGVKRLSLTGLGSVEKLEWEPVSQHLLQQCCHYRRIQLLSSCQISVHPHWPFIWCSCLSATHSFLLSSR